MRKLATEKRAAILHALCEGNSVASTCRMLRVSKVAGVADHPWTMLEFVEMVEREEAARGGRITDYLPNPEKSSKAK